MNKIKATDQRMIELLSDLESTYSSAKFKFDEATYALEEYGHKLTFKRRHLKAKTHFKKVVNAVYETLKRVEIKEDQKDLLPKLWDLQQRYNIQ